MKRSKKEKKARNPVAVAMMARYGKTVTTHRDRRERRPKDARNDFRNEEW
jgi:hypothetical protein